MLRRGSFTSPAMNVMLCHESLENNDPFIATAIAPKNASPDKDVVISCPSVKASDDSVQGSCQFASHTEAFAPIAKPQRISAASDTILMIVKNVWIKAPFFTPLLLM